MTPQEKKRLSLKKDCRNTYGENDKSSRKAIRFRKRWVNRSFRRETNALIESSSADEIDSAIGGVRRKLWKKSPDTPVGEMMLRDENWSMERRLWEAAQADPDFLEGLSTFLATTDIEEPRLHVIMRRVRAITLDQGSSELNLDSKDLELLTKSLGEQTNSEQHGADQPATAPESKSEGNEKLNPEAERRSQ